LLVECVGRNTTRYVKFFQLFLYGSKNRGQILDMKAKIFLEFPQNVISKDITSPKVPICPIFEKNERTVL